MFKRLGKKPPRFFIILQRIGIAVAGVSAVIIAAPVALPATVVTIATYAAFGSTIIAAVSQLPNEDKSTKTETK